MGLKDAKIKYIIDRATELFLQRSVGEVTVKDISDAVGVGEATVYRYFGKKQNIVIKSALNLQNEVYQRFFKLKGSCGYDKLKAFYDGYLQVFLAHAEYYRFISGFDAFMISERNLELEEYSEGLDIFIKEYLAAYREGLNDGSIREIEDVETFYYATAHSVLELCKKLAGTDIVKQDAQIAKETEIKRLIDIILYNVKNPSA